MPTGPRAHRTRCQDANPKAATAIEHEVGGFPDVPNSRLVSVQPHAWSSFALERRHNRSHAVTFCTQAASQRHAIWSRCATSVPDRSVSSVRVICMPLAGLGEPLHS